MIKLDPIIIEFISNNLVSIGLFLGVLKGIARVTPWAFDNKIATMLETLYTSMRGGHDKNTNRSKNPGS